jgi:hypothetical protein
MNSYLDWARDGVGGVKTYIGGAILIFFIWQMMGGGLAAGLAVLLRPSGMPALDAIGGLSDMSRYGPIRAILILLLNEIVGFAGLAFVLRMIHRRSVVSLITYRDAIDWKKTLLGFGTWLAVVAASTLVDYARSPALYSIRLAPAAFFPTPRR